MNVPGVGIGRIYNKNMVLGVNMRAEHIFIKEYNISFLKVDCMEC